MNQLCKAPFVFAHTIPVQDDHPTCAAQKRGNPNIWFSNVDPIVSERIGRETVTDVSNIDKYHAAYRPAVEEGISENRDARRPRSRPHRQGRQQA